MTGSADEHTLPDEGRLAGIDFGTRRIGIAICDANQLMASPYDVCQRGSTLEDAAFFKKLVDEESLVGLVVGLPVYGSGDESQKSLFSLSGQVVQLDATVEQQVHGVAALGGKIDHVSPCELFERRISFDLGDLVFAQPFEQVTVLEKPEIFVHGGQSHPCKCRRCRQQVSSVS